MADKLTVVLVEDHTIVRQGLRRLLEENGIEVIGEAPDGRKGVRMARDLNPDVVVMDIKLPKLNGIDATRKIRKENPHTKVIMLTIHDDEYYVNQALKAGANGYLAKETAAEVLISAIDSVMKGNRYIGPNFPPGALKKFDKMIKAGKRTDDFSRLTDREREILQLIAEGNTSKQIAEQLFISGKTVENHRANIMKKLEIHETAGLVRYAIRIGLVDS